MIFNKIEVIKILGISLLSAVLFNSFSSNPIDYIYKPVQSTEKQVVSLEDAKKLVDAKEVLFIDARPLALYKRGHIPGAISVPYNSAEKEKLMADIAKDKEIVSYCYSARCSMAHKLADSLRKLGYTHVSIFEGGIVEWTKAKYPLDKTEDE